MLSQLSMGWTKLIGWAVAWRDCWGEVTFGLTLQIKKVQVVFG
jgi:hypothetical protein